MLISMSRAMLFMKLFGVFEVMSLTGHTKHCGHQHQQGKKFHRRATYLRMRKNATLNDQSPLTLPYSPESQLLRLSVRPPTTT